MSNSNLANLYQPIYASMTGPAPVVIRTVVKLNNDNIAGGVPQDPRKIEDYILISSLPVELQQKVVTAIQALLSGM